MIEVGADIEREAVRRNPAADADANRGKFLLAARLAGPHARQSRHPACLDAEECRGTNQHRLEIANVVMHIAPIRIQVEDRIADELAGAVVRDVAAAARLEYRNAGGRERSFTGDDVRALAAGLDAERDDRRMFEQQQRVANRAAAALLDELLL